MKYLSQFFNKYLKLRLNRNDFISRLKIVDKSGGYSLIELLVVIGVFAVLGVVTSLALTSSLRGSRKSDSTIKVRESVDLIINTMERNLRRAERIDCNQSSSSRIEYYLVEDPYTMHFFEYSSPDVGQDGMAINPSDVEITNMTFSPVCPTAVTETDYVDIYIKGVAAGLQSLEGASYETSTKILLRNY